MQNIGGIFHFSSFDLSFFYFGFNSNYVRLWAKHERNSNYVRLWAKHERDRTSENIVLHSG
jgi:hypothetical protein